MTKQAQLQKNELALHHVKVCYPRIYQPGFKYGSKDDSDENKEYSAVLRISQAQYEECRKKAVEVIADTLRLTPEKAANWFKARDQRNIPFKELSDEDSGETYWELRCKKQYLRRDRERRTIGVNSRPVTWDLEGKHTEENDEAAITDGCFANARVALYVYNGNFKGIGCEPRCFQFREKGEPLSRKEQVGCDVFDNSDFKPKEDSDNGDGEPWF